MPSASIEKCKPLGLNAGTNVSGCCCVADECVTHSDDVGKVFVITSARRGCVAGHRQGNHVYPGDLHDSSFRSSGRARWRD
jgi:hypothetical protein